MDNLKEELKLILSHKPNTCITRTRMLIVEGICSTPDFIRVEDLWIKLRAKHRISRAAVYHAINVLVKKGVLSRKKQSFGYTYSVAYDQFGKQLLYFSQKENLHKVI